MRRRSKPLKSRKLGMTTNSTCDRWDISNSFSAREGGHMICSRCGDLLVEDRFMDWTARWRCLRCGHVQDSLSVQSYLKHQERALFVKSSEPDYSDEEVHLGSESFVGVDVTSRCLRSADERSLTAKSKATRRSGPKLSRPIQTATRLCR